MIIFLQVTIEFIVERKVIWYKDVRIIFDLYVSCSLMEETGRRGRRMLLLLVPNICI